ncbi:MULTISPECIES: helix-turn-helix domain-containing protein [unclassified Streptomyces]|uniref:helix-turn-helix domain-containing protein n=1 Tax=unclassified Streptomyces TaxID=2593676 RepID=UPI00225105A5|nr:MULTISPECIES: helix-turn-helix domain-containing protein [unclassified Streptomyces]MCX5287082.1 helix-turn-helix domain-containing protein [Streptomyces sp. NBC_00183]
MTDHEAAAHSVRVGTDLRAHRLACGMSLRRLAQELHLGASTLSDYERGRRLPPVNVLTACERILGVPAGELIQMRHRVASSATVAADDDPSSADSTLAADDPPRPEQASPDAVDIPASGRPPVSASRGRRAWWTHTLIAAAAGAALALAAQELCPLLLHRGSPLHGAASLRARPSSTPAHAVPEDDRDPRDSGCDADAVTLSTIDVDVPNRPYHLVVGQAVARYSPACRSVWARFDPTPALNQVARHAHITLSATRPADGRHLRFDADYVNTFMWGNMLLTSTGCVAVSVTVTAHSLATPATASTPCLTGAAKSSP